MTDKTVGESDELQLAPASGARQPGSHRPTPSDWSSRARTLDPKPYTGLYEHRDQEPLSRWEFAQRMARHAAVAGLVILASLALGTWGYERFGGLTWGDSFVNASMLLAGKGQVTLVTTRSGKLFAALFALYSWMISVVLIATILAPVFHRILHRFHWYMDRRRTSSANRRAPE